jgi:hypothetical protein
MCCKLVYKSNVLSICLNLLFKGVRFRQIHKDFQIKFFIPFAGENKCFVNVYRNTVSATSVEITWRNIGKLKTKSWLVSLLTSTGYFLFTAKQGPVSTSEKSESTRRGIRLKRLNVVNIVAAGQNI